MKALKYLLVVLLVLPMSACDSFLDVNTDPDAATEVPGALLFTRMLAGWGSNRAMEGGQYTNYFSQTFSSNNVLGNWVSAENYVISSTAVNNHWLGYFGDVQRNAALATESALAAEPQRVNEAAQFQILSALNYYEATLLWEDVPYTQANQPEEFPTPEFDSQRDILYGILDQLDAALDLIVLDAPGLGVGGRDLIYGTMGAIPGTTPAAQQMDRWQRFGNSVKLHVLMTLRGGGENVDSQIQELISNPNLIREASQNAYIPFDMNTQNPLGRMQTVYPGSPDWFWSGKPITDIMNATNDPRRPIYMLRTPSSSDDAPVYANAPAATGLGVNNASRTRRDTYLHETMAVPLMYAHEVLFLEAEFLAEQGNLSAADDKFREGIRQAFAMLPARANGASVSVAAREQFIEGFPSLTTLSQEDALRAIWHQHYVGLHGDGIQSWTLVRRVGEPVFGLSFPAGTSLPTWISRWPYQVNEVAANPNAPQQPNLETNMWFQSRAQQ